MEELLTYQLPSKNPIVACAISGCGTYLAFNSDIQTLQVVSLKGLRSTSPKPDCINFNNDVLFDYKLGSPITFLEFGRGDVKNARLPHRSNKRRITYPVTDNVCLLAAGLKTGQIKIFSLIPSTHFDGSRSVSENQGNAKLILHEHYEEIVSLSFARDSSLRMASIGVGGKVCLWDMWDDGNMYKAISITNNFRPICCAWGNQCKQICLAGHFGKGYVFQSEKPCLQLTMLTQIHQNEISACKYSSDDSLLVTASFDTSVVVWCAGTYKPLQQFWQSGSKPSLIMIGGAHNKYIRDISIYPDCVNFVTVSDDGYIRMWNLDDCDEPEVKKIISTSRRFILHCVKLTPDGKRIIVCTSEGKIHIYNKTDASETLANLCRKSLREKLVYKMHYLHEHEFTASETPSIKPASLLEMSTMSIRRRSVSDTKSLYTDRAEILVEDMIQELPIPGMLKSYLQFGMTDGCSYYGNRNLRTTGGWKRHHSIF